MTAAPPKPKAPASGPSTSGKPVYGITPPGQKHICDNSHPEAVSLVKRMGSKRGYNPIPPSQHHWQRVLRDLPVGVHVVWSWMMDHTAAWGHRCEYAVDKEGNELHMEHLAADCEMDLANAYLYWNLGAEAGLFARGTKETGKRRLFICGEVVAAPAPPKGEEEGNGTVCTHNFRPYILNQINKLAEEQRQMFWDRWVRLSAVRKGVQADLIAASRLVIDQDEDNLFRDFEINKIREEHKNGISSQANASRQARIARLLPQVRLYVDTISADVQTPEKSVYDPAYKPDPTCVSLLPVNPYNESEERAGEALRKVAAVGEQNPPNKARSSPTPKPVAEDLVSAPRSQKPAPPDEEERGAVNSFLSHVSTMQTAYPHTKFGSELVSPENRGDVAWALAIVREVGLCDVDRFVVYLRGQLGLIDVPAMGKLPRPRYTPAHNPEERFLGLISEWARDFRRAAPKRRQEDEEVEAQERKSREFMDRQARDAVRQAARVLEDPSATERDLALAHEVIDAWEKEGQHA